MPRVSARHLVTSAPWKSGSDRRRVTAAWWFLMRGYAAQLPRPHRRPVFCERGARSAAHCIESTPRDEPDLRAPVGVEPPHLATPLAVLTDLRPVLLVTPEVLLGLVIVCELKAGALERRPRRRLVEGIAKLAAVPVARHPAPVQQRRRCALGLPDPLRNLCPVQAAEIQHPEHPHDCPVAERLFGSADPQQINRKTNLGLRARNRL